MIDKLEAADRRICDSAISTASSVVPLAKFKPGWVNVKEEEPATKLNTCFTHVHTQLHSGFDVLALRQVFRSQFGFDLATTLSIIKQLETQLSPSAVSQLQDSGYFKELGQSARSPEQVVSAIVGDAGVGGRISSIKLVRDQLQSKAA